MSKQSPHAELGLNEVGNAAELGGADGEVRGRKVLAAAGITDRAVAAQLRARAAVDAKPESTQDDAAVAEPAAKAGDSQVTGRGSRADRMSTAAPTGPAETG